MSKSVKWVQRGVVTISAPVANLGDRVLVANYRAAGCPWESGTLERAEYRLRDGAPGVWHYSVWLNRRAKNGNRMWRYVRDDGIKLA